MRYRNLDGMPLAPSLVCLGGGPLGSAISVDDSFKLLDTLVECGGNWVDTAHVYAAWLPDGGGLSERAIGAWLKARGVRKSFMVGTKGAHPDLKTMSISRLRPQDITQDLFESLERLGSDYVDIYWLHRDDPAVPVGEIISCLNEHRAAGRIYALGASNWTVERITEANDFAARNQLAGFCASQIAWSLAERNYVKPAYAGMLAMDAETLQFHRQSGLPAVAYSSQAGGLFNKITAASEHDPEMANTGMAKHYFNPVTFRRAERARELAARYGCDANTIAVAYLLNQSFAGYAITGCRTVAQVRSSCSAADLILSVEEVAWLEG